MLRCIVEAPNEMRIIILRPYVEKYAPLASDQPTFVITPYSMAWSTMASPGKILPSLGSSEFLEEQLVSFDKSTILLLTKASHGIPSLDSRESSGPTTRVCSIRYVVQYPRIWIQGRVDESNWILSSFKPKFVDAIDNGRKDRSAGWGTSGTCKNSFIVDGYVVAISCYIRISIKICQYSYKDVVAKQAPPSTKPVINASVLAKARAASVVRIWRIVLFEVIIDSLFLVLGAGVDIAKPSAWGVCNPVRMPDRINDSTFWFKNSPIGIDFRRANIC